MKTKQILNEWKKYMSSELLLEASRDEVIDVIGQEDYDKLTKLNRKASQDQHFLQVIMNTYKANENHSIEDILGIYNDYTRFIAPRWNKNEPAKIDVPGGLRASITRTDPNSTYNTLLQFTQACHEMTLKTKAYKKCLDQGAANTDFEVIVNDSEWVICYPKTIKGSISLARSYWDGERLVYDVTFSNGVGRNVGRMGWCTSIVGGGNMFLNYHRKRNLHMYYCIKKNMNTSDEDRKLCISIAKKHGDTSLMTGHESVDGNNDSVDEELFRSSIGKRYDDLFRDAELDERLEIDEKAYYESISIEQYKVLRVANEDNIEDLAPELFDILRYSRDREKIFLVCVEDKNVSIRRNAVRHNDCSGDLLRSFSSDNDIIVRRGVVSHFNCPIKVLEKMTNDPSPKVRIAIASKHNCPADILRLLDNDDDPAVIRNVVSHVNCPANSLEKIVGKTNDTWVKRHIGFNLNCPPNVLRLLANDPHVSIKMSAVSNHKCPDDVLRKLAGDESRHIVRCVASNPNSPKDLLETLAENTIIEIRLEVASNSSCHIDILKKLANDRSLAVRRTAEKSIESRYDPSNQAESILKNYVKLILS